MRNARRNEHFDTSTHDTPDPLGPTDRYGSGRSDRARRGPGRRGGGGRDGLPDGRPGRGRRGERSWGEGDRPEGSGRPGAGRRRGGRARRGDVRAAVVALLAERPMHGYEIIQELDERTGGAWRPSPGSVYPTLSLLEDEGLVTATEDDGKRRFALTDTGREALVANRERGGDRTPWEQVTSGISPDEIALRRLTDQIGVAVRQVAETADPAGKTRAVELLTETRKRLYAILAEAD